MTEIRNYARVYVLSVSLVSIFDALCKIKNIGKITNT
jgi:hypothetical protein